VCEVTRIPVRTLGGGTGRKRKFWTTAPTHVNNILGELHNLCLKNDEVRNCSSQQFWDSYTSIFSFSTTEGDFRVKLLSDVGIAE
jgi:hypothetical protein